MAFKKYGIKVVWAGGDDRAEQIGFRSSEWKKVIGEGTRMLIYETGGSDIDPTATGRMSIIGEVEVIGKFEYAPERAHSPRHPWLVPVKPIGAFPCNHLVPLADIHHVLGNKRFAHEGETWCDITEAQYLELIQLMTS